MTTYSTLSTGRSQMPGIPHKIRVYRRVVDAFGSELELLAALNRLAKDLDGRLLDSEEVVELPVPHETWELFRDGRGTHETWRLRSLIALALLELHRPVDGRQPGTLMIAEKETVCPFCGKPVEPENPMVNTYGPDGVTRAVHVFCANREEIPYRATGKLAEGMRWFRRRAVSEYLREQLEKLK